MVPGHDERAGAAGASAHGDPGIGIVREFDVGLRFDQRKDFVFDKLGIATGHGVVLEAALTALRIAGAVADGDCDLDGHLVLGDEIVENRKQGAIGTVRSEEEWGWSARN